MRQESVLALISVIGITEGTAMARLPTKYFNPCFSLCLRDLILRHKRSDLMLDGNRRWKTEFASEPKRVHLRLLSQSGGMNSPSSFHGGVKLLHRWGASGISQENRQGHVTNRDAFACDVVLYRAGPCLDGPRCACPGLTT